LFRNCQPAFKDIAMNTKTFFAAAFAAIGAISTMGASSAFASEGTDDYLVAYAPASKSTLSRTDVQTETLRARAAGQLSNSEQGLVIADTGMALTRAQVRAETLEAIRVGAISRHEQSELPTAAQLESIRLAGLKALTMTLASR
jgi:hypothetical protein